MKVLKEQLRCMCVNRGMGRRDKCNEMREKCETGIMRTKTERKYQEHDERQSRGSCRTKLEIKRGKKTRRTTTSR